jgi:hypothetical protein
LLGVADLLALEEDDLPPEQGGSDVGDGPVVERLR